ncbi:MAG: hypothetical protein RLZZ136_1561 [Pseudomonadota bacterium]|jgi:phosphoglycolate phosphatase
MTSFPFKIVGFDLDGTLLDTSGDLGMALNYTLRRIGRPEVPLDQVSNLIGGGARMMLDRALALTGGTDGLDKKALHHVLLTYYEANIAVHSCLYPGTEAMLDDLANRDVKLAVVTNKMERLARHLLDTLGLTQRFVTIIGGDTLGPGRAKPEPDMVLEMISRLGGGRAAFVGDTTYDTRAASAAGIPCVGVSFGFLDAPLEQLGATATISHYDKLIPTLMQI